MFCFVFVLQSILLATVSATINKMSAQSLLFETVAACDVISVLVKELYTSLSGDSAKLKEDQVFMFFFFIFAKSTNQLF